jgi:hypothetical protein
MVRELRKAFELTFRGTSVEEGSNVFPISVLVLLHGLQEPEILPSPPFHLVASFRGHRLTRVGFLGRFEYAERPLILK